MGVLKPEPVKVAVLGGGAGALAAADELSRKGFKVTVYQMGWRLGGKGATGRRLGDGRDLEHGLHVLGGFYHNAMGMLRRTYAEWPALAPKTAIPFNAAFVPQSRVHIMENGPSGQFAVRFPFPENSLPLGAEPQELNLRTIAGQILRYILHTTDPGLPRPRGADYAHEPRFRDPLRQAIEIVSPDKAQKSANAPPNHIIAGLLAGAVAAATQAAAVVNDAAEVLVQNAEDITDDAVTMIETALKLAPGSVVVGFGGAATVAFADAAAAVGLLAAEALDKVLAVIQESGLLPAPQAEQQPDYGILFEIGVVVARGILADGLWYKGFDAANGVEFETWMADHGLSKRARESAYFRCGYDYAFAYVDGDPEQPIMAAGSGLRGFLRMCFTYNRSVFVHMHGGMGEIVFTPLYEGLKSRGVDFKFFHRIDELELDLDGRRLSRIRGTIQNEPIGETYDPLVEYEYRDKVTGRTVKRLVWPDGPIADRLKHPVGVAERMEFLYESPWQAPATAQPFELIADEDFDICILGIPVGALHEITRDLAAKIPDWADMLAASATTPTLTAQLWQRGQTSTLGWAYGATVLTANAPPHSTWADMGYLLDLEQTGVSGHLSYFCGPVEISDGAIHSNDVRYGPSELRRAADRTREWLNDNLRTLLPNAKVPAANVPGAEDELYVRMNSFPSELYTLTVPGKVHLRLAPGGSFVENLYLAGDWTRNGFDIGSFETAVLSGLICAREITGGGQRFPGEQDLGW